MIARIMNKLLAAAAVAGALVACQPQQNKGIPSPPMSSAERWHQAEAALVQAYIARGDVVGAARAEDFIFQMSHGQAGRQMPSLESLPDDAPPVAVSPPPPTDTQCTSRLSWDGGRIITDCR
jgi:hypothetical protein